MLCSIHQVLGLSDDGDIVGMIETVVTQVDAIVFTYLEKRLPEEH